MTGEAHCPFTQMNASRTTGRENGGASHVSSLVSAERVQYRGDSEQLAKRRHRTPAVTGAGAEPEAEQPIRLLIADHAPTRQGIRMALAEDVIVCAEAGDTQEAIRAAKREQPDVALVSAAILGGRYQAVEGICRAAPGCSVVVLAETGDPEDMLNAVRAGAIGYVPGPLDAERLRRVFRAATQKEAVVPRSMVSELLGDVRGRSAAEEVLTRREAEVLAMLRHGHSTGRIAARLQIAPVTVRRHISELVVKLGVEDRSGLMGPDQS
jgi:DNA-binding NarL/FixJ family response regulator